MSKVKVAAYCRVSTDVVVTNSNTFLQATIFALKAAILKRFEGELFIVNTIELFDSILYE